MNNLSSSQRSYLRSQAHHLEPVVLIGKHGLLQEWRERELVPNLNPKFVRWFQLIHHDGIKSNLQTRFSVVSRSRL